MNAFLASPFAAQPAALFGGLILACLIMRLGRGAFALRLFGAAIAIGVVMGTLILFVETPFHLHTNVYGFSPVTVAFLFAGFPEEAAKMVGAYFLLRPHYLNRTPRDLVLAAATLALGFALLENMLYIAAAGEHWGQLALTRALTAVPFHVFLGMAGGYAIARAEFSASPARKWTLIIGTWIILASLHAAYDLPLFFLASRPPLPWFVLAGASTLGLNPGTALYLLMLAALVCICALAFANLFELDRPPFTRVARASIRAGEGRWLRFLLARGTGIALAVILILPALVALASSGVLAFVAEQWLPVILIAVGSACPFTVGLMLLCFPPSPKTQRMTPAWRRGLQAAAAALAVGALFAGYQWGTPSVRRVLAASAEVKGLQSDVKGDHEAAIREYDRALKIDPGFTEILAKRAGANSALERYDLALADLDEAVLAQPNNVEFLMQRSEAHRSRHESAAVIADVDRAVALSPKVPALRAALALAYLEARDLVKARETVAEASALDPNDPMTLRAKAGILTQDGDIDGAIQALTTELQTNPNDGPALFSRGRLWLYEQQPQKAVADFERAGQFQTFLYPPLWGFLARTRLGQNAGPELSARVLKSGNYQWPFPVAQMFLGQKTPVETREAAANKDQRCEADFYAGELRLSRGDLAPARATLQTAAEECPPDFIEYEGALAELRRLGPESAQASALQAPVTQAADWAPTDIELIDPTPKFATAHTDRAQTDAAMANLDEAIIAQPTDVKPLLRRVELHLDRRETLAALADAERALKIAPSDAATWAVSAQARWNARDETRARADVAQALKWGPRDPLALKVQATILTHDGDVDGAMRALVAILQNDPRDSAARFALGRLWLHKRLPIQALGNFERMDPSAVNPHVALWEFLAHTLKREDGSSELAARFATANGTAWPLPVARMFQGLQTIEQVRADAANDNERCEADFYLGQLYWVRDNSAAARESFLEAQAECSAGSLEFEGVRLELMELDKDAPAQVISKPGVTPVAPAPVVAEASVPKAISLVYVVDAGKQYSGSAKWTFADKGTDGSELDAEISFLDVSARAELSIRKTLPDGQEVYEIFFHVPPSDKSSPPLSAIHGNLGRPFIEANGMRDPLPFVLPLMSIDSTTYRAIIPQRGLQSVLLELASANRLVLSLDPGQGWRSVLMIDLNANTAQVLQAAARGWK